MRTRHATNNLATHQVRRSASAQWHSLWESNPQRERGIPLIQRVMNSLADAAGYQSECHWASATGLLAFSSLKSPGVGAARLTKTSQRRGASLIELMVVIAIITTLFSMVGVVFHRLFLSEQVAMRAALTERTVSRLADQFRRDRKSVV